MGNFTTGRRWLSCAALLMTLPTLACSQPQIEPQIASSAEHAGYAQAYPPTVDGTVAEFAAAESKNQELAAGFAAYPDALTGDDVDYDVVANMFERAAEVGKSQAFVEEAEELAAARSFFEDEKDPIRKKVAGAVGYVAKQANCTADVQSAAVRSLEKVVEERLEERLRDANDAHRLLDRQRESLGKKNAAALETQLDDVAHASYLVHIAMVRHKVKLRQLIQDADQVKDTADAAIEDERAYQAKEGRSDADKKASDERIAELESAKGNMASAKQQAMKTEKDMEARTERARTKFTDALTKLVDDLRGRAAK